MGKSDMSRNRFFQQPKGFDVLLAVFKYYLDLHHKVKHKGISLACECGHSKTNTVRHLLWNFFQKKDLERKSPEGKQASKVEDVLIKIIRVIANMSINEQIGSSIASNDVCVKILISVLGT